MNFDGVFARDRAGVVGFHAARRLTTLDVAEVLAAVERAPGITSSHYESLPTASAS